MPHKHKRRQKDDETFDLPPDSIAKPLPVRQNDNADPKKTTSKRTKKAKGGSKNKGPYQDDTPREFARMMTRLAAPQKPLHPGLDEGKPQGRKRKRGETKENESNGQKVKAAAAAAAATAATTTATAKKDGVLKILPGEKMSDFAARVDQTLPLSGISKKGSNTTAVGSKDAAIRKLREHKPTKHERKLRRLQEGWREEEARIREKEAEEREEREEAQEEINDLWKTWEQEAGGSIVKKKKKGKAGGSKKKTKKKNAGVDGEDDAEVEDDDDHDPWAKLNKARSAGPSNPFDVVLAPPEKLVKPKEKFKVHGMGGAKVDVANVPAASGSLRRREQLASERKSVVEEYRKLMAGKRG